MASPKFALEYLADSDTDSELVANANRNLVILEALAQASVITRALTAPPASPEEGDFYYIEGTGTGDWLNKTQNFALYYEAAWIYKPITVGMIFWDEFSEDMFVWNGTVISTFGQKRIFQYTKHNPATILGKLPLFHTPERIWIDAIETSVIGSGAGQVNIDIRQNVSLGVDGVLLTSGIIESSWVDTAGVSWPIDDDGQPTATGNFGSIWIFSSLFTVAANVEAFNLTIKYHTY